MRQLSFDDRLRPARKSKARRARITLRTRALRHARRHWRTLAIGGTAAGILLAGGVWLNQPGRVGWIDAEVGKGTSEASAAIGMRIDNVLSEGRHNTSVTDLVGALGVARGDPILAFDTDAAQDRVEALGWVRSAVVSRTLPDTIHVRIVERRPFALWQSRGKVVLIDRDGAVIGDATATGHTHLPLVVGADARNAAPTLFDIMATEPALFGRVTAAVRIGARRWDVVFDSGLRINMPENDIAAAWNRLAVVAGERDIFNGDISGIDLRLPDRMVLRLAPDKRPADVEGETT